MTTAIAHPVIDFAFERAAHIVIDAKGSKHTKAAYRRDLDRWLHFCRSEVIEPGAPTLGATSRFRDHLLASLSKESARRAIAAMSSLYRALLQGGAVTANPFHPAVLSWPPATTTPSTRLVSDTHANAMIEQAEKADRARDLAVLRLLYDTGLRRFSVAGLLRSKYRDGTLWGVAVKGGKEQSIPLPHDTCDALDAWLKVAPRSPYVFPGRTGAMHPGTINKIVKEYADAAGASHVHPHSFRAAFVTEAYDQGLPEYEIQHSVGHADPSTTRKYDKHGRGQTVAVKLAEARRLKGKGKRK